jgi:spermidine synthase
VIGLGTGTLAAWGKPGDVFKFYELDPQVLAVAQSEFTYLRDSRATIETALGDARLTLERELPQRFDILVIDAFSSDSIPVHLITREALALYLKHMQPDGIIAFHVTNRYLDLPPVVKMIADANGMPSVLVEHDPDESDERYSRTDWTLVTNDRSFLQSSALVQARTEVEVPPRLSLWTDDFNNLLRILK